MGARPDGSSYPRRKVKPTARFRSSGVAPGGLTFLPHRQRRPDGRGEVAGPYRVGTVATTTSTGNPAHRPTFEAHEYHGTRPVSIPPESGCSRGSAFRLTTFTQARVGGGGEESSGRWKQQIKNVRSRNGNGTETVKDEFTFRWLKARQGCLLYSIQHRVRGFLRSCSRGTASDVHRYGHRGDARTNR